MINSIHVKRASVTLRHQNKLRQKTITKGKHITQTI